MVFNPDTKTNPQSSPKIVVAGDVCIDWLSIPVESLVSDVDSPPPMNWQLRGGRHMYARRGGAWGERKGDHADARTAASR